MMKNLFIAFAFALMLINPSISIAAESPVDVQEVFVGSETMDGDALKYPKGKAETVSYTHLTLPTIRMV